MEQVEGVSELNVFRAVFLAYVERRTDLLHLFLGTKRPQTPELSVVEGQTDRHDLGEQIDGSEGAMVIVDVVYVDIRVTFDRRSDSLVPSRPCERDMGWTWSEHGRRGNPKWRR